MPGRHRFEHARLALEPALLELDDFGLPIANRLRAVIEREPVDRLLADAIETDGFLERLAVVFRAGVDDRDAIDELSQRNPASVIAHLRAAVLELDLDLLPRAHHKFVDRVIDGLLEQDVDPVLRVSAGAQPSDIHARAHPNVLQGAESLDARFGVVDAWCKDRSTKHASATKSYFRAREIAEASPGLALSHSRRDRLMARAFSRALSTARSTIC